MLSTLRSRVSRRCHHLRPPLGSDDHVRLRHRVSSTASLGWRLILPSTLSPPCFRPPKLFTSWYRARVVRWACHRARASAHLPVFLVRLGSRWLLVWWNWCPRHVLMLANGGNWPSGLDYGGLHCSTMVVASSQYWKRLALEKEGWWPRRWAAGRLSEVGGRLEKARSYERALTPPWYTMFRLVLWFGWGYADLEEGAIWKDHIVAIGVKSIAPLTGANVQLLVW